MVCGRSSKRALLNCPTAYTIYSLTITELLWRAAYADSSLGSRQPLGGTSKPSWAYLWSLISQTADRDIQISCSVCAIVAAKFERDENVITLNFSQRSMITKGSHMCGPPSESPPTL